jgi:hypothetical protein
LPTESSADEELAQKQPHAKKQKIVKKAEPKQQG